MEEKIINFINENFNTDGSTIDASTELISSGLIDSINTLKLVDFIESSYDIEFEAHEVGREHMDTVAQIVSLVEKKLN